MEAALQRGVRGRPPDSAGRSLSRAGHGVAYIGSPQDVLNIHGGKARGWHGTHPSDCRLNLITVTVEADGVSVDCMARRRAATAAIRLGLLAGKAGSSHRGSSALILARQPLHIGKPPSQVLVLLVESSCLFGRRVRSRRWGGHPRLGELARHGGKRTASSIGQMRLGHVMGLVLLAGGAG